MHLLYVDDDRINLMLFENACAALPGLRVATAADAAEALQLAREQPPQLLVIDLHLPDGDGPALLRRLRELPSLADVPAFLCSADDSAEVRRIAADAGFAG
ncbi:MAG TPA: response regulator, partial [Rubrivivax sp.]|nr:response regulator [Rubrivivax sp.]